MTELARPMRRAVRRPHDSAPADAPTKGLGEVLADLKATTGDEATKQTAPPPSQNIPARMPDFEWVEGEERLILADGRTRLGYTAEELAANTSVPALLRDPIGAPPNRADGSVSPGWNKSEQAQVEEWWEAYPSRHRPPQPTEAATEAKTPAPKTTPVPSHKSGKRKAERIRFLPDLKHPPKPRTRKKRADAGVIYFSERDRLLVQTVQAYGWLTFEQAGWLAGVSADAIRKRAKRLVAHGLLSNATRNVTNAVCLIVTPKGAREVGMWEGYPPAKVSMQRYDHHDATVAIAVDVMLKYPGTVWMTEREVQAAIVREKQNADCRAKGVPDLWTPAEVLSPRVQYLAPWALNQFTHPFADLNPHIVDPVTGRRRGVKKPDGLLLAKGTLPQVMEVELTVKPKGKKFQGESPTAGRRHYDEGAYPDMKQAYATAALDGALHPVVHYWVAEAKGNVRAIQHAIEDADIPSGTVRVAAQQAGCKVSVHSVPESVWAPFGHKYGWGTVMRLGEE